MVNTHALRATGSPLTEGMHTATHSALTNVLSTYCVLGVVWGFGATEEVSKPGLCSQVASSLMGRTDSEEAINVCGAV